MRMPFGLVRGVGRVMGVLLALSRRQRLLVAARRTTAWRVVPISVLLARKAAL